MSQLIVKSEMQVGALQECSDLEFNGYRQIFFYHSDNLWIMKLHHRTNGRTLVVKWKPDGYQIIEGKLILKSVGTWF